MIYLRANQSIKAVENKYSRIQYAEKAFRKGIFIRTNLSAGYVRAIRHDLKKKGKRIGAAIRSGNAKEAAMLMRHAVSSKAGHRRVLNEALYDDERRMYKNGELFGVLSMETNTYCLLER